MKQAMVLGLAAQLPWLVACTDEEKKGEESRNLDAFQTLLDILIPMDQYGPGAVEFYADKYIQWYLEDDYEDPASKRFVSNGMEKFSEFVKGDKFLKLSRKEQESSIQGMYETNWGASWMSRLITLSFEAMLCHPIYNINPERSGWEWLNHIPGSPEPTKDIMYPQIFKTIQNG